MSVSAEQAVEWPRSPAAPHRERRDTDRAQGNSMELSGEGQLG